MAYTTATEVQADFKDMTFSATTNVTTTDVTGFITEADALINAYVGAVYVVPVASGDGLNLLKLLSRSLTTIRIKRIMKVKQETAKDAEQNVVDTLLSTTQVMKILSDIQNKKLSLAGAEALTSGLGFSNNNVGNDVEPVIRKQERQW